MSCFFGIFSQKTTCKPKIKAILDGKTTNHSDAYVQAFNDRKSFPRYAGFSTSIERIEELNQGFLDLEHRVLFQPSLYPSLQGSAEY